MKSSGFLTSGMKSAQLLLNTLQLLGQEYLSQNCPWFPGSLAGSDAIPEETQKSQLWELLPSTESSSSSAEQPQLLAECKERLGIVSAGPSGSSGC